MEKEHGRLRTIRDRLVHELAKYDIEYKRLQDIYDKEEKKRSSSSTSTSAAQALPGGGPPLAGTPLRGCKIDVHEMYGHLRKIRPKIAQKMWEEMGQ